MEKSFFVFECKTEQEYGEILAILSMHQLKPYEITDELYKFSQCGKGKPSDCLCQTGCSDDKLCLENKADSPIFADLSMSNVKNRSYMEENAIENSVDDKMLYEKTDLRNEIVETPTRYDNAKIANIYKLETDEIDESSKSLNGTNSVDSKNVSMNLTPDSRNKRKRRDVLLKKFHEFVIELLLDTRYEHLIHVSGNVRNNFVQFTIPDRRKFATVWGIERGDKNYSSTALVNKDFWNAQKAEIFTRILFQDPMLVYKIEPKAEVRFSRVLSERNLTMTAVLEFCRQRLRERGNI